MSRLGHSAASRSTRFLVWLEERRGAVFLVMNGLALLAILAILAVSRGVTDARGRPGPAPPPTVSTSSPAGPTTMPPTTPASPTPSTTSPSVTTPPAPAPSTTPASPTSTPATGPASPSTLPASPTTPTPTPSPPSPSPPPAPLPEPQPTPRPTVAGGLEDVVVRPGDTLWDLAEQELGDPRRWTDLFGASRCTTQSGGITLTDPDRILPGWVVRVPTTSGGPPSPACGQ